MSDFEDQLNDELPKANSAGDLCRRAFSRCSNWPEDRDGQIGLAEGLKLASDRFHVTEEALIARCREISAFCPTDADLLRVASDMFTASENAKEANRDRESEWRKQYGNQQQYDWKVEAAKISANIKSHREKWRQMEKLVRAERQRQNRPMKSITPGESLQLQLWAQQQVGIEITPEQRKELTGWYGLPFLPENREDWGRS